MPFLDKCFDPSTVYQCLSPSTYLVLRFSFFSTSLLSFLTTLNRLSSLVHRHDDVSANRRFFVAGSLQKPTWYISRPFTTQLLADWPAPESSRWFSSLFLPRSVSTAPRFILSTPLLRSISYIVCLCRLSSIRLGACAETVQQYLRLADLPRDGGTQKDSSYNK